MIDPKLKAEIDNALYSAEGEEIGGRICTAIEREFGAGTVVAMAPMFAAITLYILTTCFKNGVKPDVFADVFDYLAAVFRDGDRVFRHGDN